MFAFPGHGAGILDHRFQRIKQGSIPVLFENPPAAFDRVVLAVIGRIIGQADREMIGLRKLHEPLHELSAPTVALWTIVQIDEQGRDVGKALFNPLPPVDQSIHQAIAGHFGRHPIQKELIGDGQENAYGGHCRCWLKVVVSCLGGDAALASSGKGADLDCRLGIHREP